MNVKTYFVKSFVYLFMLAGMPAFADVLTDNTKLLDIMPGAVIIIQKPFEVITGAELEKEPLLTTACSYGVVSDHHLDAGARLVIPTGTKLFVIAKQSLLFGPIEMALYYEGGDYLFEIDCETGILNPFTSNENITIGDLRRTFGYKFYIEGKVNLTSSDQNTKVVDTTQKQAPVTNSGSSVAPVERKPSGIELFPSSMKPKD